jgi:hypothetical protein
LRAPLEIKASYIVRKMCSAETWPQMGHLLALVLEILTHNPIHQTTWIVNMAGWTLSPPTLWLELKSWPLSLSWVTGILQSLDLTRNDNSLRYRLKVCHGWQRERTPCSRASVISIEETSAPPPRLEPWRITQP